MISPSPPSLQSLGTLSLRAVAIGWGVLCVLLALKWFVDLGMSGFPDGYISPYARATSLPLHVLAWACAAQGACFLVKGVVSGSMRAHSLCLQLAVAAALTVAPVLVLHHCPHRRLAATPIRRSRVR